MSRNNKKLIQELQHKTQLLNDAQKIAHIGSWDADWITNNVFWSEELYSILGLTPDKCTPSFENFISCLHPDDKKLVKSLMEIAMKEQRPFNSFIRIIRPDGSVRNTSNRINVFTDGKGSIVRMAGTCQDITGYKGTDQEIPNIKGDYDIFIKVARKLVRVNTQDVLYVEVKGDYASIHTISGIHTVHTSIKNIETKLQYANFMRVHHSFIVRLDKISSIEENHLTINKKNIPISRSKKAKLIKRLQVI